MTPKITTPDAPHPEAEIQIVDYQSGAVKFRWLDDEGNPVDSGNSIAYFTPGATLASTTTLRAAIEASTADVAAEEA